MDAVVMDGTALGILGDLPKFHRVKALVPYVPRIPDRQFMMRTLISRALVDSIMQAAKKCEADGSFDVR